jgi:peroxiredoxin
VGQKINYGKAYMRIERSIFLINKKAKLPRTRQGFRSRPR